MRREGCQIDVIPQPVNFFTNTRVEPDGAFVSPPNPVPAGADVELEALMDLVCVVSSCPFDLNIDGWEINAGNQITALAVDVSAGRGESARAAYHRSPCVAIRQPARVKMG